MCEQSSLGGNLIAMLSLSLFFLMVSCVRYFFSSILYDRYLVSVDVVFNTVAYSDINMFN